MADGAVLITGASSGIGAALAGFYARPGARLFLNGRDAARLDHVADQCRALGAVVAPACIDVADRPAMAEWVSECDRQHPIAVLIANAGISGGTGGDGVTGDLVTSDFLARERRIFDINLTGTLNTIEPAIPLMAARGQGTIALMSSMASFTGWASAPAYSASKGAVRLYGEALRPVLRRQGVGVSVICPGFVRSRITDRNDFPMPLLMDSDRAAALIAQGLARGKARIAFPLPVYLVSGMIGMLPPAIASWITAKAPGKRPEP